MVNAKKNLYDAVDVIRNRFNIPMSAPLDSVALVEDYSNAELYYHRFSTKGLCAAAMAGRDHSTIILDSARSCEERNFDCAHEIVHLERHVVDYKEAFQCFNIAQSNYSFQEWEANEGAAQLLVPYQDFIPRFLSTLKLVECQPDGDSVISRLAKYYFVTEMVVDIRVGSLSYEIAQFQSGIPLECIELLSKRQRDLRGITTPPYKAMCYLAGSTAMA